MQKSTISFAVLSDLHYMAWKDTNAPVEWVPAINDALLDTVALQPDFIVINGDLTNGKERDYELAMASIREICKVPVYFTMGNHEYYGYWEEPGFKPIQAQERFLHYTQQKEIYYEKWIANRQFLFLSTEHYTPDLNDAGWLSDAQLEWLDEKLSNRTTAPTFVFFHQPIDGTVADSVNTCCQSKELQEILVRHEPLLLFTGHTHCRIDRPDQWLEQNGIWYIGGSCISNEKAQARFVEVDDNQITIRARDFQQKQWLDAFEHHIDLQTL